MTQLDRRGSSDPVSAPFTPGMRENPEELALIPDEIASFAKDKEAILIVEEGQPAYLAAAQGCETIAAKFGRMIDRTIGSLEQAAANARAN